MYLKLLYRYNRVYFFLVAAFIICQLFINFKRGMVISPFYHFGMYSQVMNPDVKYTVFEVVVNGARLQGKDFTPWQWDKINQPLSYFAGIPANNLFFKSEVQRITSKAGISMDSSHFTMACNYPQFIDWYKNYLERLLPGPVNSLEVYYRDYTFQQAKLQPAQTQHSLSEVCR